MVFVVFCATDMMGTKLNYELEFPVQPTVSELIRVCVLFGTSFFFPSHTHTHNHNHNKKK